MAATTPMMLFLGIDVAGAEENGEERHSSGDAEREADFVDAREAAAAELGRAGDGLDGRGHRLELQRDVRRDADDGDAR